MNDGYLHWLMDIVCHETTRTNYNKLLTYLFNKEFTWTVKMDGNRAVDGVALRSQYGDYLISWGDMRERNLFNYYISDKPCSVLEMMVALAIRMSTMTEEPGNDDRVGEWFWTMVLNLQLNSMDDENYNERRVERAIDIMLNREYDSHGRGGLFLVPDPLRDLRVTDIWYQMSWYLDYVLNEE